VPPRWTDPSEQDQGIALLEILAYAGDMLSYYQDQIAEQSLLRKRGFVVLALGVLAILFFWRHREPDDA
jgi:hypothetical protein